MDSTKLSEVYDYLSKVDFSGTYTVRFSEKLSTFAKIELKHLSINH